MFELRSGDPADTYCFPHTEQLCPLSRGIYRRAHRSAPDRLPSSCLQHTTESAASQGVFSNVELEAVLFFPPVPPRILTLSAVIQVAHAVRTTRADVLAPPKFAAGELRHDFSN